MSNFNESRKRGAMILWHVSDRGDIAVFEPRVGVAASSPVVWAVADSHLTNYLLPRDCPRICLRWDETTSDADRRQFFGGAAANAILLIEAGWWERACRTPLWLYRMPPASFRCSDANAGYFTSSMAVVPLSVEQIDSPLRRLLEHDVELRIVPRLRPIAEAVAQSTLRFSIIRLRNALP